jgi:hypothetical protein
VKHKDLLFLQLQDENYKTDVVFLVDDFEYLINLNVILLGKDLLTHELCARVLALKTHLLSLSKQVTEMKYTIFSTR